MSIDNFCRLNEFTSRKINYIAAPINLMMENSYREKRNKNMELMRTVYNIAIGIIILGMGLAILFNDQLGLKITETFDSTLINIFGGACIIYGGFRLFRGLKKNG